MKRKEEHEKIKEEIRKPICVKKKLGTSDPNRLERQSAQQFLTEGCSKDKLEHPKQY